MGGQYLRDKPAHLDLIYVPTQKSGNFRCVHTEKTKILYNMVQGLDL